MEFLLDPNVAYVLLVVGVMLVLMALLTPGTGIYEVSVLFTLVLTGYSAYHLGINTWALVPLALALVPFLFALRFPKWRMALLAATILLAMGGSILLFPKEDGSLIGVNPLLAGFVSLAASTLLWLFVDRTVVALASPTAHGVHHLIGQIGEAKTDISAISDEGTVQVNSELWSARSSTPIPANSKVRVIGKEGLVLFVESIP